MAKSYDLRKVLVLQTKVPIFLQYLDLQAKSGGSKAVRALREVVVTRGVRLIRVPDYTIFHMVGSVWANKSGSIHFHADLMR